MFKPLRVDLTETIVIPPIMGDGVPFSGRQVRVGFLAAAFVVDLVFLAAIAGCVFAIRSMVG